MKTKVKVTVTDSQYHEFKEGELGYIDGYCRAGDSRPYAVVVIEDRIVMIPLFAIKVVL